MKNWRSDIAPSMLQARAHLYQQIRSFFLKRDVLEVDTPLLAKNTVSDPYIDSIPATVNGVTYYLQTSPEFAMKRLLASGCPSIYQLGKAFRNEGVGSVHQPEFTMLEWYRVSFNHHDLMDEIDSLLSGLLNCPEAIRMDYQYAFEHYLGIDIFHISSEMLLSLAVTHGLDRSTAIQSKKDEVLDFLFSTVIQTQLIGDTPYFVYDYPASMSALARVNPEKGHLAERFEVFFQGIELANGYHELTSAKELKQRHIDNNARRDFSGKEQIALDNNLYTAMKSGFPACAGVAMGIDRLLMIKTGAKHINEVLTFPHY